MTLPQALRLHTFFLCVALTATANPASAADIPKTKSEGTKGHTPEKVTPYSPGTTSASPYSAEARGGFLEMRHGVAVPKWWELSAGLETHVLFVQNDLEGYAPNKAVNYLWFNARMDLTANDRFGFRAGFYQRFIADSQETGLRAADLAFSYTRTQYLPKEYILRGSFTLTAPTSFASQKASNITTPTLAVGVERGFGPVNLELRTVGGLNLCKYSTAEGGNPNVKGVWAWYFEADLRFPFLRRPGHDRYNKWFIDALTLGVDFYTAYLWFYDVGTQPDLAGGVYTGAVADSQFSSQPAQQIYGWELFLRYGFPKYRGVGVDVALAFAQGDPTLGYTTLLHDGVQHLYGYWRHTSQMYTSISVRY